MTKTSMCPYDSMPNSAFWSRSVARIEPSSLDPSGVPPFKIARSDRIATGGSCFAQHMSRALKRSGYTYFVTESAPDAIPEDIATRYNFGVFSARYGNLYTVRQLLQLLRRARGQWEAQEPLWRDGERWIDPFRPFIQPRGYASEAELVQDRAQHYAAVRKMFEQAHVYVFTFGLTESWRSRVDGAVFPGCPGCNAGVFDPARHEFYNADYEDVLSDARAFIREARELNPKLRFVFTVSPVPLIATASGDHVLAATTYSKSVLRTVAGKLAGGDEEVAYFPSYEIIASQSNRARYFEPDLRSISADGVDHVMRVFMARFCDETSEAPCAKERADEEISFRRAEAVVCDEERLVGEGALQS